MVNIVKLLSTCKCVKTSLEVGIITESDIPLKLYGAELVENIKTKVHIWVIITEGKSDRSKPYSSAIGCKDLK